MTTVLHESEESGFVRVQTCTTIASGYISNSELSSFGMKAKITASFCFLLIILAGCGRGTLTTVQAASAPILQQQAAAGGIITLSAETIEIGCGQQLTITKPTKIIGVGREGSIIHDSCPTGDTITVDLTNFNSVEIDGVGIVHDGGNSVIRAFGGNQGAAPLNRRTLHIVKSQLSGATNCLVTDGLNLVFVEYSQIINCIQDGARIASFSVTLQDNWIGQNGGNGVSFIDGTATDENGIHYSGFCAPCTGNNFWLNKGHGIVYNVTGISDPRHIGDEIDSNGDVGLVASGVRDFTFNDGWIGTNQGGGMNVGPTSIGTTINGNTFTNNFGPNLQVNQTSTAPLRIQGNTSSLPHNPCDANINGTCTSLNN